MEIGSWRSEVGNRKSVQPLTSNLQPQSLLPAAFCLLAFALRLYRLDFQSLWYDEGWSVYLAQQPPAQALPLIAGPGHTHPPGYYLALAGWAALAGTSEFAVRFLSAATGILLIVAGYHLLRRLFDPAAALLGMVVLAVAPVLVVYSQETRMYMLLALEYVILISLFHRLAVGPSEAGSREPESHRDQREKRRHLARLGPLAPWMALAVTEAAALYTHYFAAILIAYLSAAYLLATLAAGPTTNDERRTLVVGRWSLVVRWLAIQFVVAIAYLPWAAVALRQASQHVPRDVTPPALATFLLDTWHFFNVGVLGPAGTHPLFAGLSLAAAAVGLLAIGLAVVAPHPDPLPVEERARPSLSLAGRGVRGEGRLLLLLSHGLLPLLGVYFVSQLRPGVHPRYVMMLAVPLFLAVAVAVRRLFAGRNPALWVFGGTTAALFAATWLFGLQIAIFDPRTFRDDVRAVAQSIARESTAADLVVFDYEDWAYRYYDHGPAPTAYLPLSGDDVADAARLAGLTAGRRDVFLVNWHQGQTDFRGLLPFLLESSGRLIDREDLPGLTVRRYRLEQSVALPPLAPMPLVQNGETSLSPQPSHSMGGNEGGAINTADFGTVQLVAAYLPETAPADNAVPVALHWRLRAATHQRLKAALSLRDSAGRELSGADVFLLDTDGLATSRWPAGAEATTYAVLPVPPGTPPLSYTIDVGVYDEADVTGLDLRDAAGNPAGKRFVLGRVNLAPRPPLPMGEGEGSDPYRSAPKLPSLGDVRLADGLILEAGGVDRSEVQPGEALDVTLRWRADRAGLPDLAPSLRLIQAGRVLAEQTQAPADGQYPTSRWQAGEVVLDRRRLRVPADASPGEAELSVAVGDSPAVQIARIKLGAAEHSFVEPPMAVRVDRSFPGVAELLGYDLEITDDEGRRTKDERSSFVLRPSSILHLTLYWRSAADAPGTGGSDSRPYTVFTHLLDAAGRLIAQHDGPPAGGQRPTTGWVKGEVITDPHPMRFRPDLTSEQLRTAVEAGPALIEIGLYDPVTGARVSAADGTDHVVLPTQLRLSVEP